MKHVICFICLFSTFTSIHGIKIRIFGGSDAPDGKYPYYAYLSAFSNIKSEFSGSYCGGSIIDKRWILTAGHCFRNIDFRDIEVRVGTIFRTGPTGTIYRVVKRIVHEDFHKNMLMYDIGLLRVHRDITFNDNVQPISLAPKDTRVSNNERATFVGFGRNEGHTRCEKLQTVDLYVYSYATCKEIERRTSQTHICTIPREGKGPCIGDSGGPLVNENGIQIGIDSHSYGQGSSKCGQIPEFFIAVSSFRHWIDENIRH